MAIGRGARGTKIYVRWDNRTGLIAAGYQPEWTLSQILSDEGRTVSTIET